MTISTEGIQKCNTSGVEKFFINSIGHLIVKYSNNLTEDLGLVVGHDGNNFYPSEIGFEIPDGTFRPEESIGWSYLSLANNTAFLYFKTSAPNVIPSTWNSMEFAKGEKGDNGKSFKIDSSGSSFPSTGLFNDYTFLNSDTGEIFYYKEATSTWDGPYQWKGAKGDTGANGIFKIDLSASEFPVITNLPIGFTFLDTDTGFIYFVEMNNLQEKVWSQGVQFTGSKGTKGDKGDTGDKGDDGKQISIIYNIIDNSYPNTLLVIGKCPAGYVVSEIQVKIEQAFESPVIDMFVRFGGTAQSEIDGTIIAGIECFDINTIEQFIVNDINHLPSDQEEIISCIFNESVNQSSYGEMKIYVTLSPVLPVYPISNSI